jgi:hypothetical protein
MSCGDAILPPTARVCTWENSMIDFPIIDLFDGSLCLIWLERHLRREGLAYPHCDGMSSLRFLRSRVDPIDASMCW